MDWFSFNYKPKDFKKGDRDKTLPEILEMKPSKVGLDFFTKYQQEIAEAGLRPETISAIHFLSDLRNKGDIFDKCYKSGESSNMKQFSPDPMLMQQAPPAQAPPAQAPAAQAPVLSVNDERPLIGNQAGGGRRKHRSGKHRSRKHRKGDHTECTHSGGKRSTRHKHKHRRTYKGGAFKGMNAILDESNPSSALPAYEPIINTST